MSDRSTYPEVILYSEFPYCDCSVQAYVRTGMPNGGIIGPRYCPKHNVIVLEEYWTARELETIAEETVEVINHETLHWILCKYFNESTSLSLDNEEISDFILAEEKTKCKEVNTLEIFARAIIYNATV